MKHSQPRHAVKTREEIDPEDKILIKYRIFPSTETEADELAVSVATALVPGVRSQLPWMADPNEHLAIVDLAEHGETVTFEVAVPVAQLGGRVNIPQLLAIAWLPSEYEQTSHVWIEDVRLPSSLLATIRGPYFGGEGIYERLKAEPDSPIVQGILKPRFGGEITKFLPYAQEALSAGLHGLVDDELMNDPRTDFSLRNRLHVCSELARTVAARTGLPKHYIPSIISPLREAEAAIQALVDEGIPGFMTNSFALGYAAFEYLSEIARERDLFIIDCSIGATLMSLPTERTGTSMELLAKLARFSGADGAHTGSVGEHWYTSSILRRVLAALRGNIEGIKQTLPAVAGQVNMANIWVKLHPFGGSCMVNLGTGLWQHPESPAKAVEQTLAAMDCVSLDSDPREAQSAMNQLVAKDKVFAMAMDHFGYVSTS